MRNFSASTSVVGVALCGVIVSLGTFWAFTRGGYDFGVFYYAWNLVLNGHGAEIYRVSPDRYLYAPGFAWLLAPVAALPKSVALAFWSLAKAGALGFVIREFPAKWIKDPLLALGLGAWGVVLLARPVLIDFEYGQINIFIMAISVWVLLGHFDRGKESYWDFLKWFVLGIAAVTKLFALPLVMVPFIPWGKVVGAQPHLKARVRLERFGVVSGLAAVIIVPFLFLGWQGGLDIYQGWYEALLAKGFPLESHNQSFAAFLHHYFSGYPTPVFLQGGMGVVFGYSLLSSFGITVLSAIWTLILFAAIAGVLLWIRHAVPVRWIALLIALLVLPSHLVWKPYFVLGIPLAILAVQRFQARPWVLVLLGALLNFTSYDIIGKEWAGRLESGSLFLWVHLILIALVFVKWPARVRPNQSKV